MPNQIPPSIHPLFDWLAQLDGTSGDDALHHRFVLHRYDKGEPIFLQDAQIKQLYFLQSGKAVCERELPSGQSCHLRLYNKGDMLNEFLPTAEGVHWVSVKAMSTAWVWRLPLADYLTYIARLDGFEFFAWQSSLINQSMQQQLLGYDLLNLPAAKSRLGHYLLSQFGSDWFGFGCNQKQLAAMLGLRPETLSRTLGEFVKQGYLARHKSQYRIINEAALRQLLD